MSRLIKIADWSGEKRGNVIFVHGLGGHPYDTWRRKSENTSCWPVWLAEDIPGLTVFSLGYVSPATNWLGTAMPLLDESANILRILLNEPMLRDGPISFVCHSLGGLIVKQVLRSAKEQRSDPKIADFLERTRQVVFIATPHTGSGKATLMELVGFLVWGSASAKDLVANKAELRDLNIGYRGLAEERRERLHHLVFYEMVDTLFGSIVAPDSADPGLPNCRPVPIREDHIAICKPQHRDDLVYNETKNFIAQLSSNPRIEGVLKAYRLEPFNIERSWRPLLPKFVRLLFPLLLIAGVWSSIQKIAESRRSIDVTKQQLDQLKVQVEDLSRQLVSMGIVATGPDADSTLRAALRTAVQGAAAGDQRFIAALDLLRRGETAKAEKLFQTVAEEKVAQIKADSKDAAAAFRNLGAIAGLSDPRRGQEAYGRALTFDPEDLESLYWYGWLNQLAGNLIVADQSINKLLVLASAADDQRGIYRANLRLGDLNMEHGDLASALEHQNKAIAIAARQASINPTDRDWQRDRSVSHNKIGDIYQTQGDVFRALENYKASLAIAERFTTANANDVAWQRDLSVCHNKIGDAYLAQGSTSEALEHYKASLVLRERLIGIDPDNATWQRDVSISYEKIGDVLQAQRKFQAALESYTSSLVLRERLTKAYPSNFAWQRDLSIAEEKIGDALQAQGDLSAALKKYKYSLDIREHLALVDPHNSVWQHDLGVSHAKIGNVFRAQANFLAARNSFETSLAIRSRLAKADLGNAQWQVDLALSHALLGQLNARQGNKAEALRLFKVARDMLAPLTQRSGNQLWISYGQNFDTEIAALQD